MTTCLHHFHCLECKSAGECRCDDPPTEVYCCVCDHVEPMEPL